MYQERDDDTCNKPHVHKKRVARSWQTRGTRKKGKQVHSFLMTQGKHVSLLYPVKFTLGQKSILSEKFSTFSPI